jgi:hypothetical protein
MACLSIKQFLRRTGLSPKLVAERSMEPDTRVPALCEYGCEIDLRLFCPHGCRSVAFELMAGHHSLEGHRGVRFELRIYPRSRQHKRNAAHQAVSFISVPLFSARNFCVAASGWPRALRGPHQGRRSCPQKGTERLYKERVCRTPAGVRRGASFSRGASVLDVGSAESITARYLRRER